MAGRGGWETDGVREGRGGEGRDLCFAAFLQDDGVDAAADVGVDGLFVAGAEVFEHAEGGFDDFLVAGQSGAAEEERFELLLDVVFAVCEGPAFCVGFFADEGPLEGF